jgi:hypothetical protein
VAAVLLLGGVPAWRAAAWSSSAADGRLQLSAHRARARRERDDPRALDRPDAPARRDSRREREPAHVSALQIEESVADADVVIGAVLIPGAVAPKLVTREMVAG